MQNRFQPVVEVRTTGAQVIGIKVCVPKKIKGSDLTFKTFSLEICSENTQGKWKKIPICGIEILSDKEIYLILPKDEAYQATKLLKFIIGKFTQLVCHMEYKLVQNVDIYFSDGTIGKAGEYWMCLPAKQNGIEAFSQEQVREFYTSFFEPKLIADKHPLILCLHGAGEGGSNASNLLADREAVAFVETNVQKIFGGAYVVAPQSPDYWLREFEAEGVKMYGAKDYTDELLALIEYYLNKYPDIDRQRIYISGASMGGWQGLQLLGRSSRFAGAILSCPANIPEDSTLSNVDVPVWLVYCTADDTVNPENTRYIADYLQRNNEVNITSYNEVLVQGKKINQHCAFLYMYDDMPEKNGKSIFRWLSEKKRG